VPDEWKDEADRRSWKHGWIDVELWREIEKAADRPGRVGSKWMEVECLDIAGVEGTGARRRPAVLCRRLHSHDHYRSDYRSRSVLQGRFERRRDRRRRRWRRAVLIDLYLSLLSLSLEIHDGEIQELSCIFRSFIYTRSVFDVNTANLGMSVFCGILEKICGLHKHQICGGNMVENCLKPTSPSRSTGLRTHGMCICWQSDGRVSEQFLNGTSAHNRPFQHRWSR